MQDMKLGSDNDRRLAGRIQSQTRRGAELKHKRILIIEDEALQALNLAMMVRSFGAEVAGIATSTQAALAEIAVTQFDCATLDLKLHGFFSLGMAKGLRDMNIPFVVITAHGEVVSDFLDVPVLQKPIADEALADALLRAMRRPRARKDED
jgi:two-component SAPR family response regulator